MYVCGCVCVCTHFYQTVHLTHFAGPHLSRITYSDISSVSFPDHQQFKHAALNQSNVAVRARWSKHIYFWKDNILQRNAEKGKNKHECGKGFVYLQN